MDKIIINEKFAEINRHLSGDELSRLEKSLIAEGCYDPLIVWKEQNVLLDGHNRHRICTDKKIDFKVEYISLPDEKAAFEWIINRQLARRNLTAEERKYLIGLEYIEEKKEEGRPEKSKDNEINELKLRQNDGVNKPDGETAARLAKKHGISSRTVERAAAFAAEVNALPPEQKAEVLAGKKKTEKKEKIHSKKDNARSIKNKIGDLRMEIEILNKKKWSGVKKDEIKKEIQNLTTLF